MKLVLAEARAQRAVDIIIDQLTEHQVFEEWWTIELSEKQRHLIARELVWQLTQNLWTVEGREGL